MRGEIGRRFGRRPPAGRFGSGGGRVGSGRHARFPRELADLAVGREDVQLVLGARQGDVGDASFGLEPLAGSLLLSGDLQCAAVRELFGVEREHDHGWPLASLRAVDGRQLDAVLVVADRLQRVVLLAQLVGVLRDAQARRVALGVLERFDLDLLGGAARALVLLEMAVKAAGCA